MQFSLPNVVSLQPYLHCHMLAEAQLPGLCWQPDSSQPSAASHVVCCNLRSTECSSQHDKDISYVRFMSTVFQHATEPIIECCMPACPELRTHCKFVCLAFNRTAATHANRVSAAMWCDSSPAIFSITVFNYLYFLYSPMKQQLQRGMQVSQYA